MKCTQKLRVKALTLSVAFMSKGDLVTMAPISLDQPVMIVKKLIDRRLRVTAMTQW